MAPIYLAEKSTKNSGPNIFREKGIPGYTPAKLSDLAVVGLPWERELAYDGYYRNVDAFLWATSKNARVFCDATGYSDRVFQSPRVIDFGDIEVGYIPKIPISKPKEENFKKLIGATGSELSGKTTLYNITRPSPKVLGSLIDTCSDIFGTGPDKVTPLGYLAYQFISGCITEFLATHTYSAFSEADLAKEGPSEIRLLKRKTGGQFAIQGGMTRRQRAEYYGDATTISIPIADADIYPEEGTEAEQQAWFDKKDLEHEGVLINNPANVVLKAKPSPYQPGYNFGPASAIPEMGGLMFPYFHGMNTPDPLIFKHMTSTFFIRLLGKDTTSIQNNFIKLRRGFNSLASTEIGRVLAHILCGIKLALDAQARLFVVYDDHYRGFALLGSAFTIIDGGKYIDALPVEKFKQDLSAFDLHLQGLDEVVKALNKAKGQKQLNVMEDQTREDVNTVNKLVEKLALLSFEEPDSEQRETMSELNAGLKKLSFKSEPFTRVNPDTLAEFVARVSTKLHAKITLGNNMKFTTWNQPYGDRLFRLLGEFGTDVPSPWNSQGTEILLDAPRVEETSVSDGPGTVAKRRKQAEETLAKAPGVLIFASKPHDEAFKDWKKYLEKGAVKMNVKERARAYRCCEITDPSKVATLWKGLHNLYHVHVDSKPKGVEKEKAPKKIVGDINTEDDVLKAFA